MRRRPAGYTSSVEIIGILILVGVIAYVSFKRRGRKKSTGN